MRQLSLNTIPNRKIFEFDLDTGTKQFKTWVYSETGLDIKDRFEGCKIKNLKEKEISEDIINDTPITNWCS